VYVSQKVGIEALANTFMKFELSKHVPLVPAIALGAIESTPLQMTSAYAALANMGRQVQPRLYQMVTDGNGETVLQSPFRESLIADERAVFVLNHILEGVVDRGTAQSIRAAGITRPIAGKTGTSNDARDAWFMGFTPNLAIGVWLGFDDNHVLGLTGGRAAVPIWTEFMRCAEPWLPPLRFIPPRGVEMVTIDKSTRQRATSGCPQENLFEEAFVADTAPVGYCTRHEGDPLSAQTERGSTRPTTPPQRRPERGFWDMLFG
jgi:membrane carboxypeptidase/penicillin-binding protein